MPGICPQCAYETLPQSALEDYWSDDLCNHRRQSALNLCSNKELLCTVWIIYCFISYGK